MEASTLLDVASTLLVAHRDALLLDPFVKISLDAVDGNFTSECVKDNSPLSWRIKLNPARHDDVIDVQYSIVEAILHIMFNDLSLVGNDLIDEHSRRLVSRLTAAVCQMMDLSENEEQELPDEE
jgi:hypothetical protein